MAGTLFSTVYNRFLGQITDDLYIELTPQDTRKDLQNLLINAIPGFEFPRQNLNDYSISEVTLSEEQIADTSFIVDVVQDEKTPKLLRVDNSSFNVDLTSEEINILAILMRLGWIQRQVTSIENTRMKYSGADFKMTSQANHLAKLLLLLKETQRESLHMQRLYKRRKTDKDGKYVSNWSCLMESSALNDD